MYKYSAALLAFSVVQGLLLSSCGPSGTGLFAKKSLHEQYGQRITDAGLRETALGRSWFQAAEKGLSMPLSIKIPYTETGYFAAERPRAMGLKFPGRRGEKLVIALEKKPAAGFAVYLDLWEATSDAKPKFLAAADTTGNPLEYEVRNDGSYIIRVQPELLKSGEYTLSVKTGPSLAFPLPGQVKNNIGSFWGAGRDRGARKHEGIDIFAAFRTPVVAATEGVVTGVNENILGGKVVWLRPKNKDYVLYYAHLDEQLAREGQTVRAGDTLGLIGNTGNARTTAPHLHFGIYTGGGAIDPFPFINQVVSPLPKINASLTYLGRNLRSATRAGKLYGEPNTRTSNSISLENNSLLTVEAATLNLYKVTLPDSRSGYVNSEAVQPLSRALRRSTLNAETPLLDEPDILAARKTILPPGESIEILASFKGFYFVSSKTHQGWVVSEP